MRVKYKWLAVLLTLLLSTVSAGAVTADAAEASGRGPRVVDRADLLGDYEEEDLSAELDEISVRQQADLVVVTVDSLEGASAADYADDFYDNNGYGFGEERDGILFLISMEERDWYLSTSGYGITAFTDAGLEYLSEKFLPSLSDGDYAEAFHIFAEQCDDYLTQARAGTPYDADHIPTEPFSHVGALLIAVAVGFVTALIATGTMRLQLHSVGSEAGADGYMKKSGLRLTREHELFLYRSVTRTERPKPQKSSTPGSAGSSRTHTSSSGRTHGGRGGKF